MLEGHLHGVFEGGHYALCNEFLDVALTRLH
jgi:hypothetical protein